MNLRKAPQKNGRIFLSVGQGYRDKDGKPRSKTVTSFGYLDEFVDKYPDPIAHFQEIVDKMNEEANATDLKESFEYSKSEKLTVGSKERNIGYAALSKIYHELALDVFFNNHQRKLKIDFNINSVVKLLVYSRILKPGSKKKAFENRGWYFDKMDLSIDDVYRALTYICGMSEDAQLWMHERILETSGRDTKIVFYDVTNYYFEIDEEDDLRRNGVCKEHRPDPIVQMGLFMDNNGIPVAYDLFPGNNNDCTTLIPMLVNIRQKYSVGKMIIVADKGMNTAKNVYYISNGRGWYIFSQKVRGGTKELQKYVLDESGYKCEGKDFKIKSRQFTRHVKIEPDDDSQPVIEADIAEKQVVFYSREYDKKAKKDREKAIQKAKDIVKTPAKYNKYNTHGAAKYISHLEFDKDTGEIIKTKSIIQFDEEKLREDEKYDGYYLIVTNGFDKSDEWIIDNYRGLWEIEETFKITKSELEARPVFLSRLDHIKAHFLTCFIALTILRLLQKRLNGMCSVPSIVSSLSSACCAHMNTNKYMAYYFDEVLAHIGKILDIDFETKYRTLSDIRKMIGETKK